MNLNNKKLKYNLKCYGLLYSKYAIKNITNNYQLKLKLL